MNWSVLFAPADSFFTSSSLKIWTEVTGIKMMLLWQRGESLGAFFHPPFFNGGCVVAAGGTRPHKSATNFEDLRRSRNNGRQAFISLSQSIPPFKSMQWVFIRLCHSYHRAPTLRFNPRSKRLWIAVKSDIILQEFVGLSPCVLLIFKRYHNDTVLDAYLWKATARAGTGNGLLMNLAWSFEAGTNLPNYSHGDLGFR